MSDPERALARCDVEIAGMAGQDDAPAWLVVLGITDWEEEKRFLVHLGGSAIADVCRREGVTAPQLRQADNLLWATLATMAGLTRVQPHFPCDLIRAESIRLLEVTK